MLDVLKQEGLHLVVVVESCHNWLPVAMARLPPPNVTLAGQGLIGKMWLGVACEANEMR
jgi:hypothetical protein